MTIKYLLLLIMLFSISSKSESESDMDKQTAYVTVRFNGIEAPDSLSLYFLRNTLNDEIGHNFISPEIITSYKRGKGLFIIKIPAIQRPGYFSLNKGDFNIYNAWPEFFLANYLVAPDDSIIIDVSRRIDTTLWDKSPGLREYLRVYDNMSFSFSGRGSAKSRCQYKVDSMLMTHNGMLVVEPIKEDTSNYFSLVFPKGLRIIENYKDSLPRLSYEILKADFVGIINNFRYRLIWPSLRDFPRNDKRAISKKIDFLEDDLAATTASLYSKEAKAISYYYPVSIIYLNHDLFTLKGYNGFDIHGDSSFSRLVNHYSGELRDKLITYFVVNYYLRIPNQRTVLERALKIVSTPYCRRLLTSFKSSHSVGSLISSVPLMRQGGETVRLSQFKGKVVFLDFWFTGCGACKRYYKNTVSKIEKTYVGNSDVVFVSISVDRQKDIWMNSVEKGLYSTDTLPNVVNLYTGGKGGDHPIIDFYKISGYPTSMLFDKEGRLFSISAKDLGTSARLREQINLALKN